MHPRQGTLCERAPCSDTSALRRSLDISFSLRCVFADIVAGCTPNFYRHAHRSMHGPLLRDMRVTIDGAAAVTSIMPRAALHARAIAGPFLPMVSHMLAYAFAC